MYISFVYIFKVFKEEIGELLINYLIKICFICVEELFKNKDVIVK